MISSVQFLKVETSNNQQATERFSNGFSSSVLRENHEQDKPALNSLSENTVAMEVT